jgi:hypothetical protein
MGIQGGMALAVLAISLAPNGCRRRIVRRGLLATSRSFSDDACRSMGRHRHDADRVDDGADWGTPENNMKLTSESVATFVAAVVAAVVLVMLGGWSGIIKTGTTQVMCCSSPWRGKQDYPSMGAKDVLQKAEACRLRSVWQGD